VASTISQGEQRGLQPPCDEKERGGKTPYEKENLHRGRVSTCKVYSLASVAKGNGSGSRNPEEKNFRADQKKVKTPRWRGKEKMNGSTEKRGKEISRGGDDDKKGSTRLEGIEAYPVKRYPPPHRERTPPGPSKRKRLRWETGKGVCPRGSPVGQKR